MRAKEENEPFIDQIPAFTRYVVFLYDQNSPFASERDQLAAKRQAAEIAEVDEVFWEDLVGNRIPMVVKMIVRFLRFQGNHKIAQLHALREMYYQTLEILVSSTGTDIGEEKAARAAKTKMEISAKLASTRTAIEQLEYELFGNETGFAPMVVDEDQDTITPGAVESFAEDDIYS